MFNMFLTLIPLKNTIYCTLWCKNESFHGIWMFVCRSWLVYAVCGKITNDVYGSGVMGSIPGTDVLISSSLCSVLIGK